MLKWLKTLPNRILYPRGLQIVRIAPPHANGFYQVSPSCQIRNLGTIYEAVFGQSKGTFVEVGAYDGESFSNTSCLADNGWKGLLIEPVPEFAQKARKRHANNPNVGVLETAIGRHAGTIELEVAGVLTTASTEMLDAYRGIDWALSSVERTRTISVEQVTLDNCLEAFGRPDVLVIDTEGYEAEVIAGFTLERWMPKVLIVELADFHPEITHLRIESGKIRDSILAAGYGIIYKDEINTVFLQH